MAKTSKQKPQTPEVAYQKVFKDVSNILDPNEDYIYRGEDEQFDRPAHVRLACTVNLRRS